MDAVYQPSNRALDYREFRYLLSCIAATTLAGQAIVFMVAYQIAELYPTEQFI